MPPSPKPEVAASKTARVHSKRYLLALVILSIYLCLALTYGPKTAYPLAACALAGIILLVSIASLVAIRGSGECVYCCGSMPATSTQNAAVHMSNDPLPPPVPANAAECESARDYEVVREQIAALTRCNEELQQFANIVSHELNEPLRAVRASIQLLEGRHSQNLGSDGLEVLKQASTGAARIGQLLESLLRYGCLDASCPERERIAVEPLLRDVLADLDPALREASGKVCFEDMPSINGDEVQIRQVFQNLIQNALKYRHAARPPVIRVEAQRHKWEWEFIVSDNGIGISGEHFEPIFTIFHRLHTSDEYDGTGLGLAICKKIISRHGGRIWVDSAPGQGSSFHFTIPDFPVEESVHAGDP